MRLGKWLFPAVVLLIWLLPMPAQAVSTEDIARHNQQIAEQWVNYCPSAWTTDETLSHLAIQLTAYTEDESVAAQNVHDWICANICYDEDALQSDQYSALTAEEVLQQRKGVCEGIANLTQVLLLEAGIPCIKVWGVCLAEGDNWQSTELDFNRINHTWNECYVQGKWLTMDCTMDIVSYYENGQYSFSPGRRDYYNPSEDFFSQTHKRLYRGADLPQDMPSEWVKPALEQAIRNDLVPLAWFRDYQATVSEAAFYALLGITGGKDIPLMRGEAAVILCRVFDIAEAEVGFTDLDYCPDEVRHAANGLKQSGITAGIDGENFAPYAYLTRQEAIALLVNAKIAQK